MKTQKGYTMRGLDGGYSATGKTSSKTGKLSKSNWPNSSRLLLPNMLGALKRAPRTIEQEAENSCGP